ncbi:MAG: hypothetical protein PHU25_22515, partial [Deltaproteobacteria bacterium]|nr:hypothetical protein [Deltaproteobacteria bacterium]
MDGQVIKEISPSGITTDHFYIMNNIRAQMPMFFGSWDDRMLAFWKDYWHLRHWLANEVMTTVTAPDGQQRTTITDYEPVYNQPLDVGKMGLKQGQAMSRIERKYRYDYMEHVGGMSNAQLFSMMLMPGATQNPLWPSWAEVPWIMPWLKIFQGLPWNGCSNNWDGYAQTDDQNEQREGNLICEIKPATEDVAGVQFRQEAVARFAYDAWGRQVFSRDFDGQIVTELHGPMTGAGGVDSFRLVTRHDGSQAINSWYLYDRQGQNIVKLLPVTNAIGSSIVNTFEYDFLGRMVQTTVSQLSSAKPERVERYAYDANGNVISAVTSRCPNGGCGSGIWSNENTSGEELAQLKTYDAFGRLEWDCKETSDNDYQCSMYRHNLDDRLDRTGRLASCVLPASLTQPGASPQAIRSALRGCIRSPQDFDAITDTYFDGRGRPYETQVFAPTDNADTRRITDKLYDIESRGVATVDADDSDGNGTREWTRTERDGLGQVVRETAGLSLGTVMSPDSDSGAVATAKEYDALGNLVSETVGRPVSGATDASLGMRQYLYDTRQALVARNVQQYAITGSAPTTSTPIWTYTTLDQDERTVYEETRNGAGELLGARQTAYDRFGRVQSEYDYSTDTSTSYQRDNLGRVTVEDRVEGASGPATKELEVAYLYDASDHVIWRRDRDPKNLASYHDTYSYYDGLGYLAFVQGEEERATGFQRDGLGNELVRLENAQGTYGSGTGHQTYSYIGVVTAYDSLGNPVLRRDDLGNTTAFDRDVVGDVVEERTCPASSTDEFCSSRDSATLWKTIGRNKDGAITSLKYSDGRWFRMDLDRFNRPGQVWVRTPEGETAVSQLFEYDGAGNVISATDYNVGSDTVDAVVVARTWDTLGNLVSDGVRVNANDMAGEALTSTAGYDGSRLAWTMTPSGRKVRLGYDEITPDQPVSAFASSYGYQEKPLAEYHWDGSRLTWKDVYFSNGALVSEDRDDNGKPAYDGFGNLKKRTWYLNGQAVRDYDYTYDQQNRLETEVDAVKDE